MGYVYIIGIIILINLVLPISVVNNTRFKQKRIAKRAKQLGINGLFEDVDELKVKD